MLLLSLVTNPADISRIVAERHGLPPNSGIVVLPLVIGVSVAIAKGLVNVTPWGYRLTVLYLLYFGSVSVVLASSTAQQPYIGNSIWSIAVLIYLVFVRRHFTAAPAA